MLNYYLVGPTGAGKSFLGPQLAKALGLGFLDSDRVIEAQMGYRTDQLLDLFGEAHLRACEADFLKNHPPSGHVVACGAGMVLLPGFLQKLPKLCVIAYLGASLDTLVARIEGQKDQRRALLEGPPGLRERLKALLESRRFVYDQAWPLRLDTDDAPVALLLEKLLGHYRTSLQKF